MGDHGHAHHGTAIGPNRVSDKLKTGKRAHKAEWGKAKAAP
jgi:hypothetical protein